MAITKGKLVQSFNKGFFILETSQLPAAAFFPCLLHISFYARLVLESPATLCGCMPLSHKRTLVLNAPLKRFGFNKALKH